MLLYPIGLPRGREGEGGGFSITLPPPGHTLSCLAFGARLPCSKHRVLSQDLWLQYISYARSELAENPNRTPGTNSDVFVLRYRTRIDRERERERNREEEKMYERSAGLTLGDWLLLSSKAPSLYAKIACHAVVPTLQVRAFIFLISSSCLFHCNFM